MAYPETSIDFLFTTLVTRENGSAIISDLLVA